MKSKTSLLVLTLCFILVQSQPVSFSIPSVIHDVHGCNSEDWSNPPPTSGRVLNSSTCSPDVQSWTSNEIVTGMVQNRLGPHQKLIYSEDYFKTFGKTQQARSIASFGWLWNQGIHTIDLSYDFVLTNPNPSASDEYSFDSQSFFPIDSEGWGITNGYDHNFGFCLESHAVFTYRGGETFRIAGDNDIWIFIDNRLAIDLGGVHPTATGEIALDLFEGLTKGNTYNFDLFYCERKTPDSVLNINTTIALYCPPDLIDACGVCQGNGECCANKCQVPKDKCSLSKLNVKDCSCKVDVVDLNKKYMCDSMATKCNTFSCNPAIGDCSIRTPIPDTNSSLNDSCHDTRCDDKLGWIHSDKGYCPAVNCKIDNHCVPHSNPNDPNNPNPYYCTSTDSCFNSFCKNNRVECESSNSSCFRFECSDITQRCERVYNTKPDDTDKCTIAQCNDSTGKWEYYPKDCESTNCSISSCDPSTGQCVVQPKPCEDYNPCTQNLCRPEDGTCYYPPINLTALQGSDTCLSVTCNPTFGIALTRLGTDIPCPNADRCKPDSTVPGCCVCRPINGSLPTERSNVTVIVTVVGRITKEDAQKSLVAIEVSIFGNNLGRFQVQSVTYSDKRAAQSLIQMVVQSYDSQVTAVQTVERFSNEAKVNPSMFIQNGFEISDIQVVDDHTPSSTALLSSTDSLTVSAVLVVALISFLM